MPHNRSSLARSSGPATASPDDALRSAQVQRRAADALLDVTITLASIHDEAAVPAALCEAIQAATGARFTGVVIARPDGTGFEIGAHTGLTEELVDLFVHRPLTPGNYSVVAELLAGRATAGHRPSG